VVDICLEGPTAIVTIGHHTVEVAHETIDLFEVGVSIDGDARVLVDLRDHLAQFFLEPLVAQGAMDVQGIAAQFGLSLDKRNIETLARHLERSRHARDAAANHEGAVRDG